MKKFVVVMIVFMVIFGVSSFMFVDYVVVKSYKFGKKLFILSLG